MVNSSSYDDSSSQHQIQDRNAKAGFKQPYNVSSDSKSPTSPCNNGFSETADSDLPSDAFAIEPTPTKTEFNSDMSNENESNIEEKVEKLHVSGIGDDLNASLCCSVPLDKVQGVLTRFNQPKADEESSKSKPTRKLLCLYCDRSFVSANLRQKHVERIHSVKQNRRVSSRRQNQQLTVTPCAYCDKLNSIEKTLKDLFHHLVNEHSSKYFGCLPCEERFLTVSHLNEHDSSKHEMPQEETSRSECSPTSNSKTTVKILQPQESSSTAESTSTEIPVKVTRSKTKPKTEDATVPETEKLKKLVNKKKSVKLKELMNKKLGVKGTRMTIKRRESKRIQAIAKLTETQKKRRTKPTDKKTTNAKPKPEQSESTNSTEKSTRSVPTCINPYPEFDSFYRVKKITDHSIDNLKISSLTFDDVFDKAFFNRIRCNIEENLLHHIDGKLFKNEESESRISNFEKISNLPPENQSASSENYGCEISLNAVTPVASLSLNSQFGEDFESQIEYGSKPSKKKNQIKTDEVVHYKYFTRRKFQASILQHKENRDLSKLDMWTQLIIKKRQQKMLDDKKSAKEMQEYTAGAEYKSSIRREELNRILDRRGPFEDLKEEASKKAALDKLNLDSDNVSHESFSEVREVLNEILNRVFAATECVDNDVEEEVEKVVSSVRVDVREIPSYLNLRQSSSLPNDEIDRSDKITLICSSQETENFELPTNQVRDKNEIVELSGEWARCRMYICAACGAKLPNMKYLMEHKSLYHQNVWVQHYEFVGNQSELYRHLSIPTLGKVGAVEESVPCKVWKRSDARVCTKCGKQCNALGELHRHILECGGDWTWMLARKKCKYRPYGTKSRRKRRGKMIFEIFFVLVVNVFKNIRNKGNYLKCFQTHSSNLGRRLT